MSGETTATINIQRALAKAQLRAVADALQDCGRQGQEQDEPEGSRYIQISHTLAVELSRIVRGAAAVLGAND